MTPRQMVEAAIERMEADPDMEPVTAIVEVVRHEGGYANIGAHLLSVMRPRCVHIAHDGSVINSISAWSAVRPRSEVYRMMRLAGGVAYLV